MSPTLCRLKRRSEFLRTAAAGLKWVTPGVIVQARRRDEAGKNGGGPRVGYTVSKKVGNAVQRNRARRRLRAAAGDVLTARGESDFDYVLIGRKTTLDRPFDALIGDLNEAVAGLDRKARRAKAPAGEAAS